MVRTLPSVPKVTPPVVARVAAEDRELPRQGSLVDGEGIKIVIHDVDSDVGMYCQALPISVNRPGVS